MRKKKILEVPQIWSCVCKACADCGPLLLYQSSLPSLLGCAGMLGSCFGHAGSASADGPAKRTGLVNWACQLSDLAWQPNQLLLWACWLFQGPWPWALCLIQMGHVAQGCFTILMQVGFNKLAFFYQPVNANLHQTSPTECRHFHYIHGVGWFMSDVWFKPLI